MSGHNMHVQDVIKDSRLQALISPTLAPQRYLEVKNRKTELKTIQYICTKHKRLFYSVS